MTLNFFGCFNVSGIKTQPTIEQFCLTYNAGNDLYVKANRLSSVVLNIGD